MKIVATWHFSTEANKFLGGIQIMGRKAKDFLSWLEQEGRWSYHTLESDKPEEIKRMLSWEQKEIRGHYGIWKMQRRALKKAKKLRRRTIYLR